ncbi:MAG: hypothetical protein OSB42_09380 [Planctomycetota bacterium]|nr:hypothetical protein [Planctomycetota bacterium]
MSRTSNRRTLRAGAVVLTLGPLFIGSGCLVTPPEPAEVWKAWDQGLSSPLGTFEALRTALRGEILVAEYRCFSSGWKSRNGISQVGYREYRDSLLDLAPHFIWGLSQATVHLEEGTAPHRATIFAEIDTLFSSTTVRFSLVQEAYMELRAGGRRLVSEPLESVALQTRHKEGQLFAWIPLEDLPPEGEVESFRLETEWRIDDIHLEAKGD